MKCLTDNENTEGMGSVNLSTLICDQRDDITIEIWSVTVEVAVYSKQWRSPNRMVT